MESWRSDPDFSVLIQRRTLGVAPKQKIIRSPDGSWALLGNKTEVDLHSDEAGP